MPATLIAPQKIRNLGVYGVIRSAEVDDHLIPDGAVTEAINTHFDRKGAVTVRLGIAGLGATVASGYPIWGLHNTQNGTMLAVISQAASARIYAYGGASWASNLTSGTANVVIRFVNFADRIIALNWGSATSMYSSVQFWAGRENNATWTTSGNPINTQGLTDDVAASPQPQYGEVYKSRMYVAGGDTDNSNIRLSRLYYSSVISSAGNITWNPSTDYVDLNPNDGENITGLKRYSLELLVFKPNYIYRFRTTGTDPDPLIKVGTRSQESVIEGKRGLYFHHDTGLYRYSGGYPVDISRAISDVVDAIPYGQFDNIVAWKDGDHIYWAIGNLTIDGVSWPNTVVRYTESSELWTVYSYSTEIRLASDYNSGAAISRILGLGNGAVATVNSGTTDIGESIKYRMITKWYEWDEIYYQKIIQHIVALCEKAQGTMTMYQIDGEQEWRDLGQLRKYMTHFQPISIKHHRIRFKIAGITSDEAPVFLGWEIPKIINTGEIVK